MHGKSIVVGVTGGIAAFKAAELVSSLVKQGAEVNVIMTKSAHKFITPLTLQTLSKNPVITDMFEEPKSWEVQHIALADKADLLAVVPATANLIGKIANGIADDMLSTTIMATQAPVLFAPAMNVHMYENLIVQKNIYNLQQLGYSFVEPDQGRLACGYEGKGRLAKIEKILAEIQRCLGSTSKDLAGKTVLVTAGGTREAIDPVRYISNHSSGKMGYAIARAAIARGARVILISGPVNLQKPKGVELYPVESAHEMHQQVLGKFEQADIIIKAAAVADYRPNSIAQDKIKKSSETLTLELVKNPDILAELGKLKGDRILIGFAAESKDLLDNAKAKLAKKNLDLIVANDITQPGAGFNHDTNIVKLLLGNGEVKDLPILPKDEVAHRILNQAIRILEQRKLKGEA